MSYMSEEVLDFIEDCGAKTKRGRSAKRGPVVFPSDYLTEEQKAALNGECKTYHMNTPMDWDEFNAMPTDLQIEYIKSLRNKFRVPDYEIADMLGVDTEILQFHFKSINLRTNDTDIYDLTKWTNWKE